VPIVPYKYDFEDSAGHKRFRKQYPVQCAWALTAWKAQGMTCEGKVKCYISKSEKPSGLTYVQLSRCTDIHNLCIGKAISLQRITDGVAKSKTLRLRLQEEGRLQSLWNDTRSFYNMKVDKSKIKINY